MLRALSLISGLLALTSCRSPCWWDAGVHDPGAGATPGLWLSCPGEAETPLSVHLSSPAPGADATLHLELHGPTDRQLLLFFPARLADGTYTIDASVPGSQSEAQGLPYTLEPATGSFTFARARTIPFVDGSRAPEGPFDVSIDLRVDLRLGDEGGCVITTRQQTVRHVESGAVQTCDPTYIPRR